MGFLESRHTCSLTFTELKNLKFTYILSASLPAYLFAVNSTRAKIIISSIIAFSLQTYKNKKNKQEGVDRFSWLCILCYTK